MGFFEFSWLQNERRPLGRLLASLGRIGFGLKNIRVVGPLPLLLLLGRLSDDPDGCFGFKACVDYVNILLKEGSRGSRRVTATSTTEKTTTCVARVVQSDFSPHHFNSSTLFHDEIVASPFTKEIFIIAVHVPGP